MCRSIKPLRRYSETATDEEIRAAARQFVRKVSGFQRPTSKHVDAFEGAIDDVATRTKQLLDELVANITAAAPKS